jgi:UDP:flavonoid glycosyltransferase YjiC (YdhE family)
VRIVVATHPERAHFFGMVPTAWALRAAGHEVRIAAQRSMTELAAETGLTVMPLGGDGDGSAGGEAWRAANDLLVDDLVAFCRQWRPDLVLWEASTYAGAVAARASGAAHGRFLSAPAPSSTAERAADQVREWSDAAARRWGVTPSEDLLSGRFSIHAVPEGLDPYGPERGGTRLSVRPVPYRGAASLPAWAREKAAGVRVLVDGASWGRGPLGERSLALAAALPDAEVVVLSSAPSGETPLPEGVREAEASSLHLLMETASVVVHGGGFDVACAAAVGGLPQVAVLNPGFADAEALMRAVAERGCGAVLTEDEAVAGALPEAVSRMAGAEADALAALRKEAVSAPAPDELVPVIEEFAERFGDR